MGESVIDIIWSLFLQVFIIWVNLQPRDSSKLQCICIIIYQAATASKISQSRRTDNQLHIFSNV